MKEITITKENFEKEVLLSDIPVLVDFWASWCMPCKMLDPTLSELSVELEGKAKIAKINVDEEQELAAEYNILSIPTVMIFKDGQIKDKVIGLAPKDKYIAMLSK